LNPSKEGLQLGGMETSLLHYHNMFFVLGLCLLFAFSNGYRDSSTIVATVVSTRVLTPHIAFLLCALFEFSGALFLGTAVASRIGSSLTGTTFSKSAMDMTMVLETGLLAAIFWGVISWWKAWPVSNNHALIAGLTGASLSAWGIKNFYNTTWGFVFLVLIISPFVGFLFSAGITRVLRIAGEWMTPRMKLVAQGLHLLACLTVSSVHGSNDGQLVLAILITCLSGTQVWGGEPSSSEGLPSVLRLYVALAISLGVLLGGRRLLKKLGMKFFHIRDEQGLGAEMAAAGTIVACGLVGFPASTTQVITGSIIGAGVAKNPKAVRWHLVQEIMLSWVITYPVVILLGYLFFQTMRFWRG
jgi:PiT family inorganic phosphate transporter